MKLCIVCGQEIADLQRVSPCCPSCENAIHKGASSGDLVYDEWEDYEMASGDY